MSLDDHGRLHLRITQHDGHWNCAEVVSVESFGLGTYRFHLATPVGKIDPNVTLGLFTWSDAREYTHREIDVECGKWGNTSDTNNAQFVVQPYQSVGHLIRFQVPPEMEKTTYVFNWQTNCVAFQAFADDASGLKTGDIPIAEWKFKKKGVPQPGDENARINLWLMAAAPKIPRDSEVIVSKFEFEPSIQGEK